MSEQLKTWTEVHCARCGERYLALCGEPKEADPEGLCLECEMYARGRREGYAAGLAAARAVVEAHGSRLEAAALESKGHAWMLTKERALACWQIVAAMDAAAESVEEERQGWLDPNERRKEKKDEA